MTVAAYSRGVLAADTCFTECDGDKQSHRFRASKITVVKVCEFTLAIVTAGDDDQTERYEAAVRSAFEGLDTDDRPTELRLQFDAEMTSYPTAIVMFRGRNWSGAFRGENLLRRVDTDDYVAIGADASVALGAMHAGAGPIAAVRAGVYHGVMSAAPIEYLDSTFFEVRRDLTCM